MTAPDVELAQAIADALTAGTFSLALDASREYLTEADLKDLVGLHATVYPTDTVDALADRGTMETETTVNIALRCKIVARPDSATAYRAELDALRQATREIMDLLAGTRHRRLAGHVWTKNTNPTPYQADHLEHLGQYTSIVEVVYKTQRPIQ